MKMVKELVDQCKQTSWTSRKLQTGS